ncbi:site-specific integrase (plasmid) [Verrucomicrobiaceae bacterium 227]
MSELTVLPENIPLPWLETLPAGVRELFEQSAANNSMRAYRSDLIVFLEWCAVHKVTPLPCEPLNLIRFCEEQADGFAMSTVARRASAISWIHRRAGYLGENNPRTSGLVSEGLRLLRRRHRDQRQKQAKELSTDIIRETMKDCQEDLNLSKGKRDRALILIGFASAMRRSELCRMDVEDLNFVIEGLEILIPWSKTDQEGEGHIVRIARGQTPLTCPVEALREWLNHTKIMSGKVFRRVRKNGSIGDSLSDWSVWDIIKKRMKALGLKNWDEFAGHSMRSGFASTAANNGASIQGIKTQGNWKSDDSVMRYIRNKEDWDNAASYKLGL